MPILYIEIQKKKMKKIYAAPMLAMMPFSTLISLTLEVKVHSSDNTMFKDQDVSNELGQYLFVGADPEDVTVDSVVPELVPAKAIPGSTTVTAIDEVAGHTEAAARFADSHKKQHYKPYFITWNLS